MSGEVFEGYYSRLQKLAALLAEGSGATEAEVRVATEKLDRLCAKYGVKKEDLWRDTVMAFREFAVSTTKKWAFVLFLRCAQSVVPDVGCRRYRRKGAKVFLECTMTEYIELDLRWQWHRERYEKELGLVLKSFDLAYVTKHDLWFKEEEDSSASPPSEEDLDIARRAQILKHELKDELYRKMISSPQLEG